MAGCEPPPSRTDALNCRVRTSCVISTAWRGSGRLGRDQLTQSTSALHTAGSVQWGVHVEGVASKWMTAASTFTILTTGPSASGDLTNAAPNRWVRPHHRLATTPASTVTSMEETNQLAVMRGCTRYAGDTYLPSCEYRRRCPCPSGAIGTLAEHVGKVVPLDEGGHGGVPMTWYAPPPEALGDSRRAQAVVGLGAVGLRR